jgi:hypothetical protein
VPAAICRGHLPFIGEQRSVRNGEECPIYSVMNIRAIVLTLMLLIAMPLVASDYSDVIVMKNGDRMTCEIMSLQSGVLSVKLSYVDGAIGIQWSEVAHLESSRLFLVKTEDGTVYTGKISTFEVPGGRPVGIQIAAVNAKEVSVPSGEIISVARTSQKFWERFDGAITTGLLYSKGNQSAQYSVESDVEYQRERWLAQAGYSSSFASSSNSNPTTRNQGDFSSLRLLRWNNWFYTARVSFLQSSVQDINLQTTLAGGVGRYLRNTNKAKWYVAGGLAWQNTAYSQYVGYQGAQNSAAVFVSSGVSVFRFKKTNLDLFAIVLPDVSDLGRVRTNATASYYVKIFSDLSWNISFYGDWDSRPPPTFSGSDYGSSSGLSWKFGNR